MKFDLGFEFSSPENIYFGMQYVCLFCIKIIILVVFILMKLRTDGFRGIISIYKKTKYSRTVLEKKTVLESAGHIAFIWKWIFFTVYVHTF